MRNIEFKGFSITNKKWIYENLFKQINYKKPIENIYFKSNGFIKK